MREKCNEFVQKTTIEGEQLVFKSIFIFIQYHINSLSGDHNGENAWFMGDHWER